MTSTIVPRLRKIALAAAVSVGAMSVLAGATPLTAANSAEAMAISPATITWGGHLDSSISCSEYWNQVRLEINASVQTGFFNGQWLAFRFYLSDGKGSLWTGWETRFVHYNGYRTTPLFDATFNNVGDGGYYSSYVELMWHDGQRWSNPVGRWSQRFQAGFYSRDAFPGFCVT
jgi:hypothetical protein